MNTTSIWVGIDVSQNQLDLYVHPLAETLSVKNDSAGIAQLIEFLTPLQPERVVLESTGRLERLALCELAGANFAVALANPQRVRSFAKALGKVKTDRLDAQVLARFGEATQLAPYPVPEALALQLMDVVSRRRQLVEILVAEKNRLSRASSIIRPDIALRANVRTFLKCSIYTITKAIEFIPPLSHPVFKHTPPMLDIVQIWAIRRQIP